MNSDREYRSAVKTLDIGGTVLGYRANGTEDSDTTDTRD